VVDILLQWCSGLFCFSVQPIPDSQSAGFEVVSCPIFFAGAPMDSCLAFLLIFCGAIGFVSTLVCVLLLQQQLGAE
jgi:hypothetical protein